MLRRIKKMKNTAQVTLEFTFCMVIVLLMIFGLMRILAWAGKDMISRAQNHDAALLTPTDGRRDGIQAQIDPYFSDPEKINAIFKSNP